MGAPSADLGCAGSLQRSHRHFTLVGLLRTNLAERFYKELAHSCAKRPFQEIMRRSIFEKKKKKRIVDKDPAKRSSYPAYCADIS